MPMPTFRLALDIAPIHSLMQESTVYEEAAFIVSPHLGSALLFFPEQAPRWREAKTA